jgi:hypothetical protein
MKYTKLNTLADKIIKGDPYRKTRLHDEKGHLVGVRELWHLLPTFASYVTQHFGMEPTAPWLCYSSIFLLNKLIKPDWKVIEFGSGLSTIYFAKRVQTIVSIEHSEEWSNRVRRLIKDVGARNVRLDFRSWKDYEDCSEWADGHFDFCLVDGIKRLACVKSVIAKIRYGGFIYLDDSDVIRDSERQEAERLILDNWKQRGAMPPTYWVDFAPALLHVKEAMLAQL